MSRRVRKLRATSLAGLLIAAVIYVGGNLLVEETVTGASFDLTERSLFTLSDAARATLAQIDEPIELHLFYTDRLGDAVPFYASYARRIRALLHELADLSAGKVILHEHDPEPFSDAEDRAVVMGVQGIPIEQGGNPAYFGLAGTNSVDDVEAIAFFAPDRENLLEYDLVELIHALSAPEPTVLGLISSLPLLGDMQARMQGVPSRQWALARELTRGFEVVNLPPAFDALPDGIRVLMIVHPPALGEREQFVIEQFLLTGGRAIVFLDPKSEAPSAMRSVLPTEVSSSVAALGTLFSHWGVAIPPGRLAGDRSLAWRVNAGSADQPVPADYLVWLGVTGEHMAQNDPVTARLPVLNLASAGYIERCADSSLELEPLLSTTQDSAPVPVDVVAGLRPDIVALAEDFVPDDQRYVLGARLSGRVTSAYAGGAPPHTLSAQGETAEPPPALAGQVDLILVADSDLLQDHFWMRTEEFYGREVGRPYAANASFVLNAIENLGGSNELIGLRSRGVSHRPFERIETLRQRAEVALRGKEQALREQLAATRERIESLEGVSERRDPASGERVVEVRLSAEERTEVEALRGEMLSLRAELRDVRQGLRKDVESLVTRLQVFNLVLVPLAVALIAIGLSGLRALSARRRVVHG